MADLSTNFTSADLEALIEAIDDRELLGNQEYHVMNLVKSMPVPDEEDEVAHKVTLQIKEHFAKREDKILLQRRLRQEETTFLKAKILLARKVAEVSGLFEMSQAVDLGKGQTAPREAPVADKRLVEQVKLAEEFIRDCGIWEHFQRFLKDRKEEVAE